MEYMAIYVQKGGKEYINIFLHMHKIKSQEIKLGASGAGD